MAAGALLFMACTSAAPTAQPLPTLAPLPVPPETAVLWTLQFGSDGGGAVAVDGDGNVYVARRSLTKYDPEGKDLWTHEFGFLSKKEAGASGVAVDSDGSIYVVGTTDGALPGHEGAGGLDVFLLKYDPTGEELWTRQFGLSGHDEGSSVDVGPHGNIYMAGSVPGALPGQVSVGSRDAFVRQYEAGGNEVWTRQCGSAEEEGNTRIAVDSDGNVYVFGFTFGALSGHENATEGDFTDLPFDVYLRKYDPTGQEVWTRQFGSFALDFPSGVAIDKQGNVYVAGTTGGALASQANSGGVFLRKYDPLGEELWTRQFSTGEEDYGGGVAIDRNGNVYLVGTTFGLLPGQAKIVHTHEYLSDAFLRQYDSTGTELWTHQLGTSAGAEAFAVAVDEDGNVYVAGRSIGKFPDQVSAEGMEFFLRKYGR